MKLLVLGSIYGNIDLINKYAEDNNCDGVLCTGNVGIYYQNDRILKRAKYSAGNFYEYINGKKKFVKPTVVVPGTKENFKLVNYIKDGKIKINNFKVLDQGEKYKLEIGSEEVGITGVGKGYSPSAYIKDKQYCVRKKYFNRQDIFMAMKNYETNILLMHELPGPHVGKGANFSDDTLVLLTQTFGLYAFCGKYERWFAYPYNKDGRRKVVLTFLPKAVDDYGILDTSNWNLYSIKTINENNI